MTAAELPAIGQRIRFSTATAQPDGVLKQAERIGTVTCLWFNGEGDIIDTDAGSCFPYLGDTWRRVTGVADDRR